VDIVGKPVEYFRLKIPGLLITDIKYLVSGTKYGYLYLCGELQKPGGFIIQPGSIILPLISLRTS